MFNIRRAKERRRSHLQMSPNNQWPRNELAEKSKKNCDGSDSDGDSDFPLIDFDCDSSVVLGPVRDK